MNPLAQFMSPSAPVNPMLNKMAMIRQVMQNPAAFVKEHLPDIRQAMQNPAVFVKEHFPDIPDSISNNPNAILNYLQQTRGITDQDIQRLYNTYGMR